MAITTNNLISRQTVGSANATSISFTNIPQTFTDLKIVVSTRSTSAAAYDVFGLTLNTSGSGFTNISLYGNGASGNVYSEADTTFTAGDVYGRVITASTPTSSQTASVFSSFELYIPNYTGGGKKTVSIDAVAETNDATSYGVGFDAALSPSVGAVTEMGFKLKDGSFVQYSTFSLYGISSNTSTQNTSVPSATGGDVITTDGTYWYHAFKYSGTFTPLKALTADYLVVAGAGGGGNAYGGGGGAGGLRCTVTATGGGGSLESALSLATTAYTVTVGAGGAGGTAGGSAVQGTSGSNSVFSTITSTGGGGGGSRGTYAGLNGGSGGGGRITGAATGTSGQGYNGGYFASDAPNYAQSAGGGAGAVGGNGSNSTGGNGGNGVATSISGSSVTYAGGGGGGTFYGGTVGTGGTGGGGNAGTSNGGAGVSGTANLGSGGGGASEGGAYLAGGAGGSGIVIVRYAV